MCKEMLVIPVDRVVNKKRIIGRSGGPRRRRGTRGRRPPKMYINLVKNFTIQVYFNFSVPSW
jgi:hypothetical protein